jgi:hypothetical protein
MISVCFCDFDEKRHWGVGQLLQPDLQLILQASVRTIDRIRNAGTNTRMKEHPHYLANYMVW